MSANSRDNLLPALFQPIKTCCVEFTHLVNCDHFGDLDVVVVVVAVAVVDVAVVVNVVHVVHTDLLRTSKMALRTF